MSKVVFMLWFVVMSSGAQASEYIITGEGINSKICNSPTREDATIVSAILEALYASGADEVVTKRIVAEPTGTFCVQVQLESEG